MCIILSAYLYIYFMEKFSILKRPPPTSQYCNLCSLFGILLGYPGIWVCWRILSISLSLEDIKVTPKNLSLLHNITWHTMLCTPICLLYSIGGILWISPFSDLLFFIHSRKLFSFNKIFQYGFWRFSSYRQIAALLRHFDSL